MMGVFLWNKFCDGAEWSFQVSIVDCCGGAEYGASTTDWKSSSQGDTVS